MKIENKYLLYGNKQDCNGCGICTMVCPKNCIEMKEDEEGFLYPVIDESRCIHCNRCKNICSNINSPVEYKGEAYAAVNLSEEERRNSASGGMYYILAKEIINRGGVVFGVEYAEDLHVQHNYTETLEECKKFSDSKYVRSDLNGMFKKVKEFLDNDRWVLFTGTSCQTQALKIYLEKNYEKLILCDILCHANPSPKIFKMYLENLEKQYGKKIKHISFRSKENGWRVNKPIIQFDDNIKIEEETFFKAFTAELINRPSCYSCQFASYNRQSDITIGDFWGINKVLDNSEIDDDKGVSILLINTEKGKLVFEQVKNQMKTVETKKNEGLRYNRHANYKVHRNRERFFKKIAKNDITNENIITNMKKYYKAKMSKRIISKVKRTIKKLVKKI